MSEAAPTGPEPKPSGGFFGVARKIDDAVFNAEKAVVSFALVTITVVVFVDVIARRILAPDSKLGELFSKLARVEDLETRAWVDANIAPWVSLVLGLLVLGFGLYSGRRFGRMRAGVTEVSTGRELGLAAGFAVVGVAAGWGISLVFASLDSWMVYAGAFGLSALVFTAYHAVKKKEGWPVRVGSGLLGGALLVWVSVAYIPEGYTWSKQVSLMLLLWVGLLSASICVHAGKHIRMGAAQKLLPENLRQYLNGTGFLAAAVFCALMTFLGFMYVFAPRASDDEFMTEMFTFGGTRYVYGFEGMVGRGGLLEGTDIPDWLGILAAPVGFGIATFRFVGAAVSAFTGGSYGESGAEEGMEEAKKIAEEEEARAKAEAETEAETSTAPEEPPAPAAKASEEEE
ncbi:MAG: TRAP transporter small permease subunit [Sandaracinaceae bacterium]|nr:TRAP transporter small permease subunit [Sandaracinaceae bacterium]